MNSKLYRSRTDRMVAGVCGGLGAYIRLDPTIIRLAFVLLALGNGVGVILYLVLWFIIPYEGEGEPGASDTIRAGANEIAERARQAGQELKQALGGPNPQAALVVGAALVVLGTIFLIDNLNLPWLRWVRFDVLWPVLLIVGGALLIYRRTRHD